MTAERPGEEEEWVADRIAGWVETYKKSMLTPVILSVVARHEPVTIAELTQQIITGTGWSLTERGLHRTVKRLQDMGLLLGVAVDAPRTGVKRKEISLSPLGRAFLGGVAGAIIRLD